MDVLAGWEGFLPVETQALGSVPSKAASVRRKTSPSFTTVLEGSLDKCYSYFANEEIKAQRGLFWRSLD